MTRRCKKMVRSLGHDVRDTSKALTGLELVYMSSWTSWTCPKLRKKRKLLCIILSYIMAPIADTAYRNPRLYRRLEISSCI